MKAPFAVLAATLAVASAATNLHAQVTGATVVGKITDATGTPLSNALVAILRPSTGIHIEVKTNDTGSYTVPNLTPGTYNVTVSADNFGTQELQALNVAVGENIEENFTLAPPTVVQQVVVTTALPSVDLASSQISNGRPSDGPSNTTCGSSA